MLYFLTRGQHMYTVRRFKDFTNANYLQIIPHEELSSHHFTKKDIAIFCDIDRCNDEELQALKSAYDQVALSGCRLLNDPGKVMRRKELLKGLYKDHHNSFRVFGPEELDEADIRYPVFVRNELEHDGPGTALIYDRESLNKVLDEQAPENALVCEFLDTRIDGHYHKYGAFVLAGDIIPRHFFLSDTWNVKSAAGDRKRSKQLEIDYVLNNPHEEALREIAQYAHVEFGRIDYALTENGIEVFEINTNPTVIDRSDMQEGNPRHFITHHFIDVITEAFKNLKPLVKNV